MAKSASAADVEAYQTGGLTWEELRTGVRKPVERPAPEIELQQTLATSGPATLGASPATPAEQTDIVDLIDETPKFTPSPKMALVLLEIADKASHDGLSKWRSAFTAVSADYAEPGGAVPELLSARAISFRKMSGLDEVRIEPCGPAEAWLRQLSFHDDDALARSWRLYDIRIDATSNTAKATACKNDGSYFTPWLNVKAGKDDLTAAATERRPAAPATRAWVPPSADVIVAMVELADKVARDPPNSEFLVGYALTGDPRVDPTGTSFLKSGAGAHRESFEGKHFMAVGADGAEWLKAAGMMPTSRTREAVLAQAWAGFRELDAPAQLESGRYLTRWLNVDVEEVPVAGSTPEATDPDDETAAQLLAAVTTLANSDPEPAEIAKALTEVGAPMPWRLSDDPNDCGVILDAVGGTVAVVDVHSELADDAARARALAIITAINSAFAEAAA